jgi:uncharacterized damage-inducible protein DinB
VYDLLFAEWLLGESTALAAKIDPARFTDSIDKTSPDAIFSAADSAFLTWRKVLEKTHEEKWDEMMSFPAPTENMKASRRKCFTHAFLHGTRHWAQLATALRRAGYKQDWQHDYKATLIEQNEEKIVMKVPHVRPGRYNISIQTGNAIYIQPVRFTVQE